MFLTAAGAAGLDPLLNISPMFIGLGSIGLMSLLALTSLGIPLFFARRGEFGFATTIAPGLGGLAVAACTILAARNYSILTGVNNDVINALPLGLWGVVVLGFGQALWLRQRAPEAYARIGASRVEADPS
jgi:hypothetical protein